MIIIYYHVMLLLLLLVGDFTRLGDYWDYRDQDFLARLMMLFVLPVARALVSHTTTAFYLI